MAIFLKLISQISACVIFEEAERQKSQTSVY